MGLDDVRHRLGQLADRTRRARFMLLVILAVGVALTTYLAVRISHPIVRGGELLMGAGFVLFFARGWRKLALAPTTDNVIECVAFHRAYLVELQRLTRGGWVWEVLPLVPGIVVTLVGLTLVAHRPWAQMAPILALLLLWLGTALLFQRKARAKLGVEISELDNLRLG